MKMDKGGVWVCSGDMVPCEKHIYDGKCPTLIELYAKERGTECGAKMKGAEDETN